jgi:hypothetical protein
MQLAGSSFPWFNEMHVGCTLTEGKAGKKQVRLERFMAIQLTKFSLYPCFNYFFPFSIIQRFCASHLREFGNAECSVWTVSPKSFAQAQLWSLRSTQMWWQGGGRSFPIDREPCWALARTKHHFKLFMCLRFISISFSQTRKLKHREVICVS